MWFSPRPRPEKIQELLRLRDNLSAYPEAMRHFTDFHKAAFALVLSHGHHAGGFFYPTREFRHEEPGLSIHLRYELDGQQDHLVAKIVQANQAGEYVLTRSRGYLQRRSDALKWGPNFTFLDSLSDQHLQMEPKHIELTEKERKIQYSY